MGECLNSFTRQALRLAGLRISATATSNRTPDQAFYAAIRGNNTPRQHNTRNIEA
ncbi:TPA: hypothetical protein I8235_003629 [Kluyvera intermedia]|nr:hypothetical protein [Kluyvera intermedia]